MINNEFVIQYENLIKSTIYSMNIKDRDTVDLLYSDCIIRLLESQQTYDEDKAAESTWVTMVTRSVVSNYIKTLNRSKDVMDNGTSSLDDSVPGTNITQVDNTPDVSLSEYEMMKFKEEVYLLTDDFPEIQRNALRMFYILGYTHKEIASKLGINPNASKSSLDLAVKRLRARMKPVRQPREFYDGLSLQDLYNKLPPKIKFPFKFRVVEGKSWRQVAELTGRPIAELERRVAQARDMIFREFNVEV